MENNFNFIDAAAAYQKALKGKMEREEKRKKEIWEAIEREAAEGNTHLWTEWYLSDEIIEALKEKGFKVKQSRGMFYSNDSLMIDWSQDEEK